MAALKGIVLDMDDTLYLERDYVRSGFRAVADSLGESRAFDFLWGHFLQGTRGNTFNLLATELGRELDVAGLVGQYRSHLPTISMHPEWPSIIADLRNRGFRLGLISDGPHEAQRRKADALGLDDLLDDVILTGEWGSDFYKPHVRAYETLATRWGVPHESLVYIADNPEKDFVAPNQLGWHSIRLRMPGGLHEAKEPLDATFAAVAEVRSPAELAAMIETW